MRKLVLLILGSIVLTGHLLAQTGQDAWDNLKQLRVGQKIEIVDVKMKTLRGTFAGYSEDAISLRTGKAESSLQRTNVVRVGVRDTSKRKRNMLLGIAIGAGGGVAAGLFADAPLRNEGHAPFFAPVLGAGGAGLGALAGLSPGYRTIYRAEARRSAPSQ